MISVGSAHMMQDHVHGAGLDRGFDAEAAHQHPFRQRRDCHRQHDQGDADAHQRHEAPFAGEVVEPERHEEMSELIRRLLKHHREVEADPQRRDADERVRRAPDERVQNRPRQREHDAVGRHRQKESRELAPSEIGVLRQPPATDRSSAAPRGVPSRCTADAVVCAPTSGAQPANGHERPITNSATMVLRYSTFSTVDPAGEPRLHQRAVKVETRCVQEQYRDQQPEILRDPRQAPPGSDPYASASMRWPSSVNARPCLQQRQHAVAVMMNAKLVRKPVHAARVDVRQLRREAERGIEELKRALRECEDRELLYRVGIARERRVLELRRQHHRETGQRERPIEAASTSASWA